MDSLARAREACTCWWCVEHLDCPKARRIANAIDEARLEEAKWWVDQGHVRWMNSFGEDGTTPSERIAELAASPVDRDKYCSHCGHVLHSGQCTTRIQQLPKEANIWKHCDCISPRIEPASVTGKPERREPHPGETETPLFNVIWGVVRNWEIQRPSGSWYSATGNDVCQIIDAIRGVTGKQGEPHLADVTNPVVAPEDVPDYVPPGEQFSALSAMLAELVAYYENFYDGAIFTKKDVLNKLESTIGTPTRKETK